MVSMHTIYIFHDITGGVRWQDDKEQKKTEGDGGCEENEIKSQKYHRTWMKRSVALRMAYILQKNTTCMH